MWMRFEYFGDFQPTRRWSHPVGAFLCVICYDGNVCDGHGCSRVGQGAWFTLGDFLSAVELLLCYFPLNAHWYQSVKCILRTRKAALNIPTSVAAGKLLFGGIVPG
jgi:hypothetical protein